MPWSFRSCLFWSSLRLAHALITGGRASHMSVTDVFIAIAESIYIALVLNCIAPCESWRGLKKVHRMIKPKILKSRCLAQWDVSILTLKAICVGLHKWLPILRTGYEQTTHHRGFVNLTSLCGTLQFILLSVLSLLFAESRLRRFLAGPVLFFWVSGTDKMFLPLWIRIHSQSISIQLETSTNSWNGSRRRSWLVDSRILDEEFFPERARVNRFTRSFLFLNKVQIPYTFVNKTVKKL